MGWINKLKNEVLSRARPIDSLLVAASPQG